MSHAPRVAFFADSFHEINGAARCCREFEAYARRRQLPFLSIHYGGEPSFERDGTVSILQLKRSKIAVAVDPDLDFDLASYRHRRQVEERLAEFRPDLVHTTSPGDAGILGVLAAHRANVPLVASWHTNLHEFAGRRVNRMLSFLPTNALKKVANQIERFTLDRVLWFFGSRVLLAPSPQLMEFLRQRTGRPTLYMGRGVDVTLFNPDQRERPDDTFTIGYVGRLMPEKSVRFLAYLERELLSAGKGNFRFLIVGAGSEREWLEANMQTAQFTGVLHGNELGRAFANLDVFAFPSQTDTFGQVVQEAQSSGVPRLSLRPAGLNSLSSMARLVLWPRTTPRSYNMY